MKVEETLMKYLVMCKRCQDRNSNGYFARVETTDDLEQWIAEHLNSLEDGQRTDHFVYTVGMTATVFGQELMLIDTLSFRNVDPSALWPLIDAMADIAWKESSQ